MIDEQLETEFDLWLESITFVDNTGTVIPVVLTDDDSEDPEGDRTIEED